MKEDFDFLSQLIVVILTLAASIIGPFISLRRKRISTEILSDTLIPLNEELSKEIELPAKAPEQVRLILMRIRNSGNVTIQSDDYLEPIRVKFGGTIFRSAVVEGTPSGSTAMDLEVGKDLFAFPKVSFRPRSSVTISTVLSAEQRDITIDGRIVDGQVSIANPKARGVLSPALL